MFLKRGKDKVVQDIEKRIADFTFIPVGMSFISFLLFINFNSLTGYVA